MKKGAVLILLLLCAVVADAAKPVKTSEKPGVDYSVFKTYSWKTTGSEHPDSPTYPGGPLDLRIRAAADKILASSGFERTEEESADLWIHYVAYQTDQLSIEGIKTEIAPGVGWIGDPHAHSMRSYREGTLVFEIVDPSTDKMIWSGWASEAAPTREKLQAKAEKVVKRILKYFPPK